MNEELAKMTEDRIRLKHDLRELEWATLEKIMETKRIEFVSVNWKRLEDMTRKIGK